ncbi:hypothetical protein PIROE2DRAFT_60200, partial [Piromyces sp. E2]
MVRADLSQYDLLYDSESSSSKHYIPTANPRDWSIFDQSRENFFNSIDFDYNLSDNCNSLSLGMDNYCTLSNNTMNNYNMPLTVDPSTIICNNNNIKLDVEEDDPIIRSILCSESEDEEVYEEEDNDEKQNQMQQLQQSNIIKTNKLLSDSEEEEDDDDDDDIDENLEEDVLPSSILQGNPNNIYNKNGSNLDLININIANKKNDLSIFTYEANKNENKNKLSKDQINTKKVELNNTNYNTTTAIHPNEYNYITLDNQGLYINGKLNENILQDPSLLTVAAPNNSLSHISTIDNNMVLPINTNNLTTTIGNNNSIIPMQHQANIQKPTTIIQTVNASLPQTTSTTRSTSKSNINHTKRAMNGSNTNKPTKKHCSKACINCKRAHLACDTSRPCKRCVSQGRTDC